MTTLLANFYTILSETHEESQSQFEVAFQGDHAIYEGHFPDQPVTPGVCLLQLATELAARAVGQSLRLVEVQQAKFLVSVVPDQVPTALFTLKYSPLENGQWKLQATLVRETHVYFKLKGKLST